MPVWMPCPPVLVFLTPRFSVTEPEGEQDMRFLYCACVISAMLGDWSSINIEAAVAYIRSCVVCGYSYSIPFVRTVMHSRHNVFVV